MGNVNFMTMAKNIAEICHSYDVPILGQVEFIKFNRGIDLDISVNDLTIEDIRKIQSDIINAARRFEDANNAVMHSIILTVLVSVIVLIVGIFFLDDLIVLFGASSVSIYCLS